VVDETADELQRLAGEAAVLGGHDVAAVPDQLHVEVEAIAGHALLDLGCEGGEHAVTVGDVADDPTGDGEEVAHLLHRSREKLDLVLLGPAAGEQGQIGPHRVDVPDLGVGILDRARDLGQVAHHLVDHGAALEERRRRVVAGLANGREVLVSALANEEELELAEGMELETGALEEPLVGDGEDVVGGERRQLSLAIEEAAHEIEAARVEGAQEHARVPGHDVEVRLRGVDQAREQRRAVHALTGGEDTLRLRVIRKRELQLLELAVKAGVVEGQPLDALLLDDAHEVPSPWSTRELGPILVEKDAQWVRQCRRVDHQPSPRVVDLGGKSTPDRAARSRLLTHPSSRSTAFARPPGSTDRPYPETWRPGCWPPREPPRS